MRHEIRRALACVSRRVLLGTVSVAIAVSPLSAMAAPASGKVVEAASRKGAAAYLLSQCPTERAGSAESAFVGVAASFVADFLVGAVEKWLAKRKAELSGEFVAGTSTPGLYTRIGDTPPQLSFGCLVIASGEFGDLRSGLDAVRGSLSEGKINNLGLADYPNFYLEARATAQGDTVTLQPIYLDYRKLAAAQRSSKGAKKVVAVIGFSSKSLAKDAKINEESAFAVYRFNFGELEVGKLYRSKDLFTGLSAVQKMPSPIVEGRFESRAANVLALVAETEDPSLALELLTSAFSSNKDALNKAIEDAVKKALSEDEEQKS